MVTPPQYRDQVLQDLHKSHLGITRTKSLARSILWWPGLDQAIVDMVKCCSVCQATRDKAANVPLLSWQWSERPLERVHVDYAEKEGKNFLVLVIVTRNG